MLKTANDQDTLLEEDAIKNDTVNHDPSFHENSELVYKRENGLSSKIFIMDRISAVKIRVKKRKK